MKLNWLILLIVAMLSASLTYMTNTADAATPNEVTTPAANGMPLTDQDDDNRSRHGIQGLSACPIISFASLSVGKEHGRGNSGNASLFKLHAWLTCHNSDVLHTLGDIATPHANRIRYYIYHRNLRI